MPTAIPASASQRSVEEFLLHRFPAPGEWTEAAYLSLTDDCNQLVELANGFLEVLPMPTDKHQSISQWLFVALMTFVVPLGGKVQYAPLRLRISSDRFREPDLLVLKDAKDPRREDRYWTGADLIMEIVSPDKPERDLIHKRIDYATAKVNEYWLIQPEAETISVLRLDGASYVEHGVFRRGESATSATLPGFAVEAASVFDAR